jgi:hypothetical protein
MRWPDRKFPTLVDEELRQPCAAHRSKVGDANDGK